MANSGSAVNDLENGGQKKIVIPSKFGEKLVGVLHEAKSSDVIILCHGYRSSKEESILLDLAFALEKEGIRIFRFDFAGNGESEGKFQFGNYRREVEDLHSVNQHFQAENVSIRAIVGHSKGADVVLLYASKYHDVNTVVNLAGRLDLSKNIDVLLGSDYKERIEEKGYIDITSKSRQVIYRVTKENLMDRITTDIPHACLQIAKECRVLTVHGSEDETVPVEDAKEIDKLVPSHTLRVISGANHCFDFHRPEVIAAVVEFIRTAMS